MNHHKRCGPTESIISVSRMESCLSKDSGILNWGRSSHRTCLWNMRSVKIFREWIQLAQIQPFSIAFSRNVYLKTCLSNISHKRSLSLHRWVSHHVSPAKCNWVYIRPKEVLIPEASRNGHCVICGDAQTKQILTAHATRAWASYENLGHIYKWNKTFVINKPA